VELAVTNAACQPRLVDLVADDLWARVGAISSLLRGRDGGDDLVDGVEVDGEVTNP
jgi:hypothetical protein